MIEHWIAVLRTGNVVLMLPVAGASSAWVLAQLMDMLFCVEQAEMAIKGLGR